MKIMNMLYEKYVGESENLKVLDVGSMDINGSYKEIFRAHDYTGLDIGAGKNVDIVVNDNYYWGNHVGTGVFDLVISGQCLEHVPKPWEWIKEINRVTKRGGMVIIIAPWSIIQHRYPVDCWRILPDGMEALFESAGIKCIETGMSTDGDYGDCWGVGIVE